MYARILCIAALFASALPALAADKIPIVDEGKVDQWALVPGSQLMPPYPEAYVKNPEEVCLVVGYLVNADGHTSDFALLKSWTSGSNARTRGKFWGEFSDLASRALAQWKYAPKDAASAQPVYTAATFVFGTPQAAAAPKAHCHIAGGLATRLLELRYDPRAGRMMSRGIFSQLEIDPEMQERIRQEVLAHRENSSRAVMQQVERQQAQQQPDQQGQPFPPTSGD
jgi:hypothetical protein